MERHKMQRRMIIILHIKIDRQIIKMIPVIRRNIIFKLLRRNPYRFLIDIRLIRKHFALPSVFQHILHSFRNIGPCLA